MKQILKLIFLLVIGQTAFAQAPSNYTNINGRYRWIAGMFDSTFHIPKGTTPSLRTGGSTNGGALFYKTADSSLQLYTGTQWLRMLKVGDTTGMLTPYFNSVGVGLKNTGQTVYADTLLLSTRLWRNKGIDSVQANLTAGLATKLNISDTASMLSPYARTVNVRQIVSDSLGGLVRLKALNAGGAALYTNSGTKVAEWGLGGSANMDFHGFAGYDINRASSYTVRSFTDKNYVDSAISASPSGTVTSVATNTGTGITGGTITTSGTIAADTLLLSTRAWRQKGIDSVAALANTKISGSGTTNYIPKFTSSSAIGNSQIFDNGTNVGIGTATPSVKLQVDNNSHNYFQLNSTVANVQTSISAQNTASGNRATLAWEDGTRGAYGDLYSSTYLTFTTQSSEKMRLTSGGSLGIGTSVPAYKFQVEGGAGYFNLDGSGTTVPLYVNNSSTAAGTQVAKIAFASSGSIKSSIAAAVYGNDYMTFNVGSDTERMRLDASGNLIVGGTSASYSASGRGNITIGGSSTSILAFQTGGVAKGYVYHGGTNLSVWNAANGSIEFGTNDALRATLDASGNLGLGVTPSAWSTGKTFEVGALGNSLWGVGGGDIMLGSNFYYNADFKYASSNYATGYRQQDGVHKWLISSSGTANATISFTQAMTLDASGRLGIGVTSLNNNLEVYQTGTAGNNYVEGTVKVGGSTSSLGAALSYASQNSGYVSISNLNNSGGANARINFGFGAVTSGSPANTIMTINQSGNVGIGTTSPAYKLHLQDTDLGSVVQSTSTSGSAYLSTLNSADGNFMQLRSYGNTTGATLFGASTNKMNSLWSNNDALFSLGTIGATPMIFGTSNSERMRITSGGELLIGTTSDAGDYKLQVNGNSYVNGDFTSTGTLYLSTNNSYLRVRNAANSAYIATIGVNTSNKVQVDPDNNGTEFGGSIKTAAPSGGTAKPYKWGEAGVAIGGSNGYAVKVEIDGTLYYLMTGYLPEPEPEPSAGPSMGYKTMFEQPTIKIKTESQEIKDLKKEIEELKQLIKNK